MERKLFKLVNLCVATVILLAYLTDLLLVVTTEHLARESFEIVVT